MILLEAGHEALATMKTFFFVKVRLTTRLRERANPGRFQRFGRDAILFVGAAHGVLSGQLAAGWLDGPVFCVA